MRGIVVAALMLFGAASGQSYGPYETPPADIPVAQTGDYRGIHSISIVSTLGDEFRIEDDRGGLHSSFVTDWNVDALAVATLRKYLAPRFSIVQADADAVVAVRPVAEPSPGPAGVGLHTGRVAALCVNYEIEIIDARDRHTLGKAVSRMQTHAGTPAAFACYAEDASLSREARSGLAPGSSDRLRTQVQILLPRSLVETLRALAIVSLPPPGDHSIAPPEDPADTEGIASVAVISAFADRFSFVRAKDALNGAELNETPIGWNLDLEAERLASAALARKFAVKPAEIDRGRLARMVIEEGRHPKIEGLPPSAEVDAYVLIVKAHRKATAASGAGLWNGGWLRPTYAFANYAVVLVDARTGKVLKAALPVMSPESSSAYPLIRVDGALWPDAKDRAAADKAQPVIRSLVADSLPETLYQMGLTVD